MIDVPTQGGSYTRDPKNGALTRADAPSADAPAADPAPSTDPETPKKGGK